jgi:hypothetical protein
MTARGRIFSRRSLGIGLAAAVAVALAVGILLRTRTASAPDTVTLGDFTIVNRGLVGVGRIPADLRDRFGETFGSGSGLSFDPNSWKRTGDGYEGVLYMLPDRGYNVKGTVDYRARLNTLAVTFQPIADESALSAEKRQQSVTAVLANTLLLTDAAGGSLTGLDPAEGGIRPAADGFPDLPQAPNGRVSLDAESLARLPDGSFFIGDEYGPYIYRFSPAGRMLAAIRPPDAFIPRRKGRDHFSSNNPGPGGTAPEPRDPETGRQNNQGFEGLSLTPGGRFLVVALQSATRQDGGGAFATREHSRVLYYDVADPNRPTLVREYVVPLPEFKGADGKRQIAAQSELLALDDTHFLLLCRDSGSGFGSDSATSRYRWVALVDTTQATSIAGSKYDGLVPVAPGGKLEAGVTPAVLKPFIDLNDDRRLRQFGLHNGAPNDRNNLSEKWEGMALLPALDPDRPHDFFLFISNDNDFITRNGHQVGADYKDASGADVDTMFLVYRLTLPDRTK